MWEIVCSLLCPVEYLCHNAWMIEQEKYSNNAYWIVHLVCLCLIRGDSRPRWRLAWVRRRYINRSSASISFYMAGLACWYSYASGSSDVFVHHCIYFNIFKLCTPQASGCFMAASIFVNTRNYHRCCFRRFPGWSYIQRYSKKAIWNIWNIYCMSDWFLSKT